MDAQVLKRYLPPMFVFEIQPFSLRYGFKKCPDQDYIYWNLFQWDHALSTERNLKTWEALPMPDDRHCSFCLVPLKAIGLAEKHSYPVFKTIFPVLPLCDDQPCPCM